MKRRSAARAAFYRFADRLPPARRSALLQAAGGAKRLITGEPPKRTSPRRASFAPTLPKWSLDPAPTPVADDAWVAPPAIERPGDVVRSIYEVGGEAQRFDIELFESLNAEYEEKPVVPKPRAYTGDAGSDSAKRAAAWAHSLVDLRGKRVLEIGCGHGYVVWHIANGLDADVDGVDVVERVSWSKLAGPRARYTCVDLARTNPFPPDPFDRIVSFTVWEHVTHPFTLLQRTFDLLRPGGLQFLRANLYRGPLASHRYRDVYFPWPHLLFQDDVFEEFYRRRGKPPTRAAWVNKLTWLEYERYFEMAGFELVSLAFDVKPIDEEFYVRFEDILGRYPRWDLERDFFTAVLRKPA